MNLSPLFSFQTRKKAGFALVLVLGFIVLLTIVVTAFFANSIMERQIAGNSASQTRADLFAQGAVDTIVGDLKQEIMAGSTVITVTGGSTLLIPTNNQAAPAITGFATNAGLENLVKVSRGNSNFFPASYSGAGTYPPSKRATTSSSTNLSQNNRFISAERWNGSLLLGRQNPSSSTSLLPTNAFIPPDWILVAKDGSNPTTITASSSTNVVGRYAYAIYNEGGMLDINVAGYPSTVPATNAAYKPALSFADLTQVGLTQAQVDILVGWRNYATLQATGDFPAGLSPASGTAYYNAVLGNTRGFLSVGNTNVSNGHSDQAFNSRQQLIQFMTGTSVATDTAAMLNSLRYLGTFSRDVNQPSFSPNPNRPKIVSNDGGNDAYLRDDAVNPSFLTVRAGAAFTRNDGTDAIIGEPLVKKRFVLNRLAWLTYKGPSQGRTTSSTSTTGDDADIGQMKFNGITESWLKEGTVAAIQKYFGLTWDGGSNKWLYTIHRTSSRISTLAEVKSANREPDFVELLKASVNVGALARGATAHASVPGMGSTGGNPSPYTCETYQFVQDIQTDYAIIQLAANIIDQFDADGYPTKIAFDNGLGSKDFIGIEYLPYFYRVRPGSVRLAPPTIYDGEVFGSGGISGPPPYEMTGTTPPPATGVVATFLQPEVWNPHDVSSSKGNPRPAAFRLVVDSTDPDHLDQPANYTTVGQRSSTVSRSILGAPFTSGAPIFQYSYQSVGGFSVNTTMVKFHNDYTPDSLTLNSETTGLYFSDNNGTLFKDPTFLVQPGVPNGSGLKITEFDNLNKTFSADPLLAPYLKSVSGSPCVLSMQNGTPNMLGIFLGVSPVRWVTTVTTASGTKNYVMSSRQTGCPWPIPGDSPTTYRVQYQNSAAAWVTYDQKVTDILGGGLIMHWNKPGDNPYGLLGLESFASSMDPRTSRFGFGGGYNGNANPPGSNTYPPNQSASGFLETSNLVAATDRWDQTDGLGTRVYPAGSSAFGYYSLIIGLPYASNWFPSSAFWNQSTTGADTNFFYFGLASQNNPSQANQYYADADGVVRRAMGAYASTSTMGGAPFYGLPLATASVYPTKVPIATTQSRPIMLNRPFRSVADLGYVFSGIPWRNLDMFTPESGFAALLDVFCINDTDNTNSLVAGKVDLNTRQAPVIQAILSGAYKDELNTSGTSVVAGGASSLANNIATALVARTTSADVGKGSLGNISELVGKYVSSVAVGGTAIDGSKSYDGFSGDITTIFGTNTADSNVARLREASVRALSNAGTTRVWNLMVDVVAQTGRYTQGTTTVDKFTVEGEQRYWVHIAIDRYTGQIIDKQIEVVKE